MFFEVLGFIIVFGSVIFLAYITTKILGNKTTNSMKGAYMEVVETLRLGNDKQLLLVKVGDKFLILSSSVKSLEFVCEVDIDYVGKKEQATGLTAPNFKEILDKYIGVIPIKSKEKSKVSGSTNNYTASKMSFEKNIAKLQQINSKFGDEDDTDEKM